MAEIVGIKSINPGWKPNASADQKKHKQKQKSPDEEQDNQKETTDLVDDKPHIDDYA